MRHGDGELTALIENTVPPADLAKVGIFSSPLAKFRHKAGVFLLLGGVANRSNTCTKSKPRSHSPYPPDAPFPIAFYNSLTPHPLITQHCPTKNHLTQQLFYLTLFYPAATHPTTSYPAHPGTLLPDLHQSSKTPGSRGEALRSSAATWQQSHPWMPFAGRVFVLAQALRPDFANNMEANGVANQLRPGNPEVVGQPVHSAH